MNKFCASNWIGLCGKGPAGAEAMAENEWLTQETLQRQKIQPFTLQVRVNTAVVAFRC